jgi:hypothetical protein
MGERAKHRRRSLRAWKRRTAPYVYSALSDSHAVASNLVVSNTVTGDTVCKATDKTYRIDTPSARDFLDDFVHLP